MVGARLATLKHGGDRSKSSIDDLTTQQEAAALLNVGKSSVERTRVVLDTSSKELIEVVDEGLVAVSQAVKMAKAPVKTQRKIVRRSGLV